MWVRCDGSFNDGSLMCVKMVPLNVRGCCAVNNNKKKQKVCKTKDVSGIIAIA